MISILEIVLLSIIAFGLVYTAVATAILLVQRVRSGKRHCVIEACPPVSVFKPLKGIDEDLEQNLRSFFELEYPTYELLFGVNDTDDPAIPLVLKLRREYPHVPSRLVVNERQAGVNPKVNNLINMYPFAAFEHLVISDSNVRVRADYLTTMISYMSDKSVGLVTSSVRGAEAETVGAMLENLHLNTFVAYNVFAVFRLFRVPITIGKSMLIRRDTLARLGGFAAFRDYLLEDGLIGRAIHRMGLKIATTFESVDNINRSWRVDRFLARHLRWATMRRHLGLGHYFAELLSNPILFAMMFVFISPMPNRLALFGAVLATKTFLDLIAGTIFHARLPFSAYLLVPLKELLIAAVWLIPFFRGTVIWRGNRFRIGALTRVYPVSTARAELDTPVG